LGLAGQEQLADLGIDPVARQHGGHEERQRALRRVVEVRGVGERARLRFLAADIIGVDAQLGEERLVEPLFDRPDVRRMLQEELAGIGRISEHRPGRQHLREFVEVEDVLGKEVGERLLGEGTIADAADEGVLGDGIEQGPVGSPEFRAEAAWRQREGHGCIPPSLVLRPTTVGDGRLAIKWAS
jgi:hypothetical protein